MGCFCSSSRCVASTSSSRGGRAYRRNDDSRCHDAAQRGSADGDSCDSAAAELIALRYHCSGRISFCWHSVGARRWAVRCTYRCTGARGSDHYRSGAADGGASELHSCKLN